LKQRYLVKENDLQADYRLERNIIGRGSFGVVYKSTYLGLPVAVKVIDKTLISDFDREATKLLSLYHPNIILCLGFSASPNCLLILEYAENKTLYSALGFNNPALPLTQRCNIAKGIINGIQYLHTRNPAIIHRDIKSQNILLTNFLEPKLADFGLATSVESLDTRVGILGTPWYIAPEIISTGKNYSKASDIYATAVVIWEIFEDNNNPSMMDVSQTNYFVFWKKVVDESFRPPFNTTQSDLKELITQMWDKDVSKRPDCDVIHAKLTEIKNACTSAQAVVDKAQLAVIVGSLTSETPVLSTI